MSRFALIVPIKRPVDDVWSLIMDMDRYSVAWGEHYTVKTPGPLAVGSLITEDDGETAQVIELDPPRRFTIEVNPVHWAVGQSRIGHILEPVPGGTRFTTWFEPTFVGWGRVLQPALMAYFRRAVRKPVYGVKEYLEAGRQDRWT
jgi:polyketide cyclase/dehydrase/lipid transport protein